MNIRLPVILITLLFALNAHGVEPVVHPDEKPHLLKLIERLGLNKDGFIKDNRDSESKKYTFFGKEFGAYKDRYWFDGKPYSHLLFITDHNDRIVKMRISNTSFSRLYEVTEFKNLVWLDILVTDIEDLRGLENLKRLEKLELVGSDSLKTLNGVKNLRKLRILDISSSKSVSDISGLINLPSLKDFDCKRCKLDDLNPLSQFEMLERLALGGQFQDLIALKSLKKLEYLYVDSDQLKSLNVVNELESLEELFVWVSNAQSFELTQKLPNLKDIHIVDTPLEEIPDLSNLPNLEHFTVTTSNLKSVKLPQSLPSLKKLQFKAAPNLKTISKIDGMPALEEFSLNNSGVEKVEFGHLPSLKKLTLSGTDITELNDFSNLPELTELWMKDTKVTSLEPLLDAPKLHRVILDRTARDIPNLLLILDILSNNFRFKHSKKEPQNAREVYEKALAEQEGAESSDAGNTKSRRRRGAR